MSVVNMNKNCPERQRFLTASIRVANHGKINYRSAANIIKAVAHVNLLLGSDARFTEELTDAVVATACKDTHRPDQAKYLFWRYDGSKMVTAAVRICRVLIGETVFYTKDQLMSRREARCTANPRGGTSINHDLEARGINLFDCTVQRHGTEITQLVQSRKMDAVINDGSAAVAAIQFASARYERCNGYANSQKTLGYINQTLEDGGIVVVLILHGSPTHCVLEGAFVLFPDDLETFQLATVNIKLSSVFKPSPFSKKKQCETSLVAAMTNYLFWVDGRSGIRPTLVAHWHEKLGRNEKRLTRHPVDYWNHDVTQMCDTHWIEQQMFDNIRPIIPSFSYALTSECGDYFIHGVIRVEAKVAHVNGQSYRCNYNKKNRAVMSLDRVPLLHVALPPRFDGSRIHFFVALRSTTGGLVINKNRATTPHFGFKIVNGALLESGVDLGTENYLILEIGSVLSVDRCRQLSDQLNAFAIDAYRRPPMSDTAKRLCWPSVASTDTPTNTEIIQPSKKRKYAN